MATSIDTIVSFIIKSTISRSYISKLGNQVSNETIIDPISKDKEWVDSYLKNRFTKDFLIIKIIRSEVLSLLDGNTPSRGTIHLEDEVSPWSFHVRRLADLKTVVGYFFNIDKQELYLFGFGNPELLFRKTYIEGISHLSLISFSGYPVNVGFMKGTQDKGVFYEGPRIVVYSTVADMSPTVIKYDVDNHPKHLANNIAFFTDTDMLFKQFHSNKAKTTDIMKKVLIDSYTGMYAADNTIVNAIAHEINEEMKHREGSGYRSDYNFYNLSETSKILSFLPHLDLFKLEYAIAAYDTYQTNLKRYMSNALSKDL